MKIEFHFIKAAAALVLASALVGSNAFATPTVTLYKTANSDNVPGLGYGGEFVAQTSNYSSATQSVADASLTALGYSSNPATLTITAPNGTYGNTQYGFDTFCIEENVSFTPGSVPPYNYSESNSLTGGSSPDFASLTKGAAWLYYEFATGNLAGYNYTTGRAASAAGLQALIWYLEGQTAYLGDGTSGTYSNINTDPFYNDLIGKFTTVANAEVANTLGGYGVEVMNLYYGSTVYQNQLILTGSSLGNGNGTPIPDSGATACLLGSALVAIAFLRRKFVA